MTSMAEAAVPGTNPPYVQRVADASVVSALKALGAVAIEGPRACGKTETARQ